MRLRFADLTYDGEGRRLLRGNVALHLTPKAFALLGLLLERRPAAVSRAEIQEALWPGVFVTEGNIDSLLKEIRKALGERDAASPLIRTVHGFGYAFDGAVQPDDALLSAAAHAIVWGVQTFPLVPGPNVLGRSREAAVWLGHDSVSRAHAKVTVEGERADIVDLGSRNGTIVRGRRIAGPEVLKDGDEIVLGVVRVGYRYLGGNASASTRSAG